jgi:anaerobic selenocysteine-containing dehydrogenase
VIFAERLARPGRLRHLCDDYGRIAELVRPYPPERVAAVTGIDAARVRALARAFATAKTAVCYGRMGTCAQELGATVSWLIDVLNIVTGNMDRVGGPMFPRPAVDLSAAAALLGHSGSFDRYRSRVRGLPEVNGEFPVSTLVDEIETEGPGRIRAMILHAANPVLSIPNGKRTERALASLDLLVAIDLYVNETTRHAHYILPPSFGLEHDHYGLLFHAVAVHNTAKYSEAVVPAPPAVRPDWQILLGLATRVLAQRGALGRVAGAALTAALSRLGPRGALALLLRLGPHKMKLDELARHPEGVDLGPLEPRMPELLRTPDRRIRLAPPPLVADLARVEEKLAAVEGGALLLIGRRQLRNNNSWMHNSARLVRGRDRCTLLMHPDDARERAIADGTGVSITSRVGSIVVNVELSDSMMRGVVSLPHGFGHGVEGTRMRVAAERPGVSVNDVTDDRLVDTLSGTSALNGVPVAVAPA